MDFDLAVVDEAGQIAIPDILVPLAGSGTESSSATTGSSPFPADEVRKWGVTEGDPAVESLSALEVMVERFLAANVA